MSNENLSPNVMTRLMKEIRDLCKNPPEGIKIGFNEENFTNIFADIQGPVGTPFENGVFQCRIVLGQDFPQSPPKGFFLTKIFHPNVSSTGEICVNTLKRDWKAENGIKHILMVIRCLLIVPNPASALNEDAGKLLLEDYDAYYSRAQLMTKLHAKSKNLDADEHSNGKGVKKKIKKKKGKSNKTKVMKKKKALRRL